MTYAIENRVLSKWLVRGFEHYCFGEDKCFYNKKTNRKLKPTYNNRCLGYWIDRKFISLTKLRTLLYIPKKEILPF